MYVHVCALMGELKLTRQQVDLVNGRGIDSAHHMHTPSQPGYTDSSMVRKAHHNLKSVNRYTLMQPPPLPQRNLEA